MSEFRLVEKENPMHLHGIFDSKESAERFLRDIVPEYVRKGFYMDKSLTPDSFEVVKATK